MYCFFPEYDEFYLRLELPNWWLFGFLLRCRSCGIGHIICQNTRLEEYVDFFNWSKVGISIDKPKKDKNRIFFKFVTYFSPCSSARFSILYIKTLVLTRSLIFITGAKSGSQPKIWKITKTEATHLFLFNAICCCSSLLCFSSKQRNGVYHIWKCRYRRVLQFQ